MCLSDNAMHTVKEFLLPLHTYIRAYVCTWNEASVLFSAAYSGNVELFDWLVQRFNLVPDELNAVSGCEWPDFMLCSAC